MLAKILVTFLAVAAIRADAARLKWWFHVDLDDCDDVAADSSGLYFACHSAHAPGATPANPPNMDAWVAKLDRLTGQLLYLTRLGGEGVDIADRIKVDDRGHAYVTGFTGSRDFPDSRDLTVPGGYHSRYGGGEQDGFLIEFSPSGRLCYGTYAGSTARALLEGLAFADSEKVLYAAGTVIRPIEKSSPKPNAKEKYGMFVMGLDTPKNCR